MPFTSYNSVAQVAMRHSIHAERGAFIDPIPVRIGEHFRAELEFTLDHVPYDVSEAAVRETLIYPILREVWRPFAGALTLWNNQPLSFDEDLSGIPDFLISRRSPLGSTIPDQPYLLVVEAKGDDFPKGWGQCLAALIAAQKLTEATDLTYYGVATNGLAWQFGRLHTDVFTQSPRVYGIEDLDGIIATLNALLIHCRDQAARLAASA